MGNMRKDNVKAKIRRGQKKGRSQKRVRKMVVCGSMVRIVTYDG